MYTIIMNNDKSLVSRNKTTLYQREKCVDKIQFLLPQSYGDFFIRDATVVLKYVNPANEAQTEILECDEDLYKERLRYVLPVDTKLTKLPGSIKAHISILDVSTEDGLHEEVLHTGETFIEINPVSDYYTFAADSTLEPIDRKILENKALALGLQASADILETTKADNLELGDNSIYLTANGSKVGEEIDLNTLGNALSDATDEGLVRVITEDEIIIPDEDGNTVKYSLSLDQDTDELHLLMNGKIVSTIKTKDIGESILDSTEEGLTEVIV